MSKQKRKGRAEGTHARRKRLFKAALAYSEHTIDSWARSRGLSHAYTRNVLLGTVISTRYLAEIDEAVDEFLRAAADEYAATRGAA